VRAILLALLAVGKLAIAEECPPGMLVSDETDGHCCWPQQMWSPKREVCVGVPQCVGGLVARGEACVTPAGPLIGVVVTFVGDYSTHFTVTATGGGREDTCVTPCTLELMPGRTHLRVSGPGNYQQDIDVPAQPAIVHVRRGSVAWRLAGVALVAGGLAMAAAGIADSLNRPYNNLGGALALGAIVAAGAALMAFIIGDRDKATLLFHDAEGRVRDEKGRDARLPLLAPAAAGVMASW